MFNKTKAKFDRIDKCLNLLVDMATHLHGMGKMRDQLSRLQDEQIAMLEQRVAQLEKIASPQPKEELEHA